MKSKTKQNKQKEQQVSDEEDYQIDQQERFTDEYSEYLKMIIIKLIGSSMTITKILQINIYGQMVDTKTYKNKKGI